jgi:NAD(P)-dependent dehydrogenase (short-subunit alcohol dehydrogenase family)
MRLQDKVAIITGAGQGIGLAYAERFLDEGAKVVVAELNDERGQIGLNTLQAHHDDAAVIYVPTDVSDQASAKACVAAALEEFGTVDILVNNAAIYMDLDLTNRSLEYAKQVFDVNVHGQWIMAEAVAPTMVEQSWGRIINQASIAAYLYNLSALAPGEFEGLDNYAYQHSKWSLIGLTKFMAGQLGPHNITVNAIAPGLTYTEATKKVVPDQAQGMFMMMQPIKREIQAEDMTGPAVFFASEDASMVSGQLLCVDGGMTMPA